MMVLRRIQFVLSSCALHLALHFGRSSSIHSYRYASSNDRPNCFASYNAQLDPSCNMRASSLSDLTDRSEGKPI